MVTIDNLAWTYCCNHLIACIDRPKMLVQNIPNHWCTRLHGVLTQTTLWILTTVSTSNPVPKIIKNWNIDGNVTLGKLNYRRTLFLFTQYLISHTFSTNCVHCYITSQKREETNHFQYTIHFMIRTTCWISNFYYNYTTRKCNLWLWNKIAYNNEKIRKTVQYVRFPMP
jgi:hypothetical protein